MTARRLSQVLAALVAAPLAASGCGGDVDQTEAIAMSQGAVDGPAHGMTIHGGNGGTTTFNFQPVGDEHLSQWRMWGKVYVDALQMAYELPNGSLRVTSKAGGNGGDLHTLSAWPSRHIVYTSGRSGSWNDDFCVVDDASNFTCAGGTGGSSWGSEQVPFSVEDEIDGVSGKFGTYIDSLQCWWYLY